MAGNYETDYTPVRMINEFVYCHRLFFLEYVNGEFEDSSDTIEGRIKHRRVDKETGKLPDSENISYKDEQIHASSILLSSKEHKIIARLDLVEGNGDDVSPVEYKKGKPRSPKNEIWDSDRVQIALQAIILKENGYKCNKGIIYYAESKERITVEITEELVEWAINEINNANKIATLGNIPPPLVDSVKCVKCSLVSICLPDEINSLTQEENDKNAEDMRRLYPARTDAFPVIVEEQGATIGKKDDELVVRKNGEVIGSARLMQVSNVCLMGNVQISTQAVKELCDRNIPLCYFSTGGWFNGITHGMSHKNIELRIKQFSMVGNKTKSIEISRRFIEGKIRNCRTMLRRNSKNIHKSTLDKLSETIAKTASVMDEEILLGIEGMAGRIYFSHFSEMLRSPTSNFDFNFDGRNRRPPQDNVNAILSYLYALLTKDFTVTALAVGFDPYLGFFHKPKYGKPALALDLMEEFRPIVCDSVAISTINNGEITQNHFIKRGGAVGLTSPGKKALINAYERRLDDLIIHPLFKYSVSYRRAFEIQTRLLARLVNGELKEYPIFTTR